MRYLIQLKPLEPYFFGGDNTFGSLGEENGSYLAKSTLFPQQSAILGMIKKEILVQSGVLTRKKRGEWVDKDKCEDAITFTGSEKFDIFSSDEQNFGVIKKIEPLFLLQNDQKFIKKVAIDNYSYKDGVLIGYNSKIDIYDNFVSTDNKKTKRADDIFRSIENTGNKTGGKDNSLFKKSSYLLNDGFLFAFYADIEFELKSSVVKLGADSSKFKMEVQKEDLTLSYNDKNGYLTLLSDSYITVPIKDNCDFAITSEISFRSLKNKKDIRKENKFKKSQKVYLYEKGSIFINPSQKLIDNLNNSNLQQIGYNTFTPQGEI